MSSVGWILRSLGARIHGACGWISYRLGLRAAARRHFERVLLLRGGDFTAYVHLGRIAFDVGDYAGWRRELEHARRLDPERFARLRHPLELFEPRLAGTTFDHASDDAGDFEGTGSRATWRSLRPSGTAPHDPLSRADSTDDSLPRLDDGGRTPGRLSKPVPSTDASADDAATCRDDCATEAERQRLFALGPIDRLEAQRCDLDELLRKLSG
jgi:hypothetical protein